MVLFSFILIFAYGFGSVNSEVLYLTTYSTATNDDEKPFSLSPPHNITTTAAPTLRLFTEPVEDFKPLRQYHIPDGTPAGVYFRISQKVISIITFLSSIMID